MEARFRRVWLDMAARRDGGEPFERVVRTAPTATLVAALAAASEEDALAANVIATEILNRTRRAPYLGAFLVSVTMLGAIFALDFIYTGTPLFLDSGARAYALVGLSTGIALVSVASWFLWRGSWARLHAIILPPGRDY